VIYIPNNGLSASDYPADTAGKIVLLDQAPNSGGQRNTQAGAGRGPYEASTTANVIATAGDALLSMADPSSDHPGHLVNGSFFLPEPLQARARNAANTGTAYNDVGSSLNLLQYEAPISNDAVSLQFSQKIGANDALRTGTYGKTLTFTLSTTTP
jgi:hypothetical protein